MALQYDIESGQTTQQILSQHAIDQNNGLAYSSSTIDHDMTSSDDQITLLSSNSDATFIQRSVDMLLSTSYTYGYEPIKHRLPSMPQFTYAQRLAGFTMFFIGALFLYLHAFFLLPQIIFGSASRLAWSFTLANLLMLAGSCFVLPMKEYMAVTQRRTHIVLYIMSMLLTFAACTYFPTMFVVLPILTLQIVVMVCTLMILSPCGSLVGLDVRQVLLSLVLRNSAS